MKIESEINTELKRAEEARSRGNEGQARVCARRAAGIAAREYLIGKGIRPPSASAMDLLQLLKDDPLLPPDVKRIADLLMLRVNEEFNLPVQADLIAEARTLCNVLLNQKP